MKKFILFLCLTAIAGCALGQHRVADVLDNPGVFQDSLYTDYQQQADKIETRYLNKEISYADYVTKKQELEERYKKEADKRATIILGE
jgi:hypothetical protein